MKKYSTTNSTLKNLVLSALVAAPVFAPVALRAANPDTTAANLSSTSGVAITTSGSTVTITAPDRAILTWGAFSQTAATDALVYTLPTGTSSVLNRVIGGAATTIAGQISSNGKVYLINPAGITVAGTAVINTAGFVASAVNEPDGTFASTGDLSYVGTPTAGVTVASGAAIVVGGANKAVLAGNSVSVAGSVYGNLYVKSYGGAANIGAGGDLLVSKVASEGGLLDVNATTSSTGGTVTFANDVVVQGSANVVTSTGAAITDTAGGTLEIQGASTFNAGTTGNITLNLGTNKFGTVSLTGNNITIADSAQEITLGTTSAAGTLAVTTTDATAGLGVIQQSGVITSTGAATFNSSASNAAITLTNASNNFAAAVNVNAGTGAVSIKDTGTLTLGTQAAASVTYATTGNVSVGAAFSVAAVSLTTTGGTITQTAGSTITSSGTTTLDASGAITLAQANDFTTLVLKNGGAMSVTDANGLTLGAGTSAAGNVSVTATTGNIDLKNISVGGDLSLTATTGTITDSANGISVTGKLTLRTDDVAKLATADSINLNNTGHNFGQVNVTSESGKVTITEDGDLNLGTVTVKDPVVDANAANAGAALVAKSISGNIINTGVITVPVDAALNTASFEVAAGKSITLDQANVIGAPITIVRADTVTLKNTVASVVTATNAITGLASFENTGGTNLTLVSSDWAAVGFTNSGTVVINDTAGVTIKNVSMTGAGALTVNSTGNIDLGESINVTTTGLSTFDTSGGSAKTITDSANGVGFYDNVAFITNGGEVLLNNTGHNFGGVSVDTTFAGATAAGANVTITEANSTRLRNVTTGSAGNLTVTTGNLVLDTVGTAINVGGTTTLTAGADIMLNAGNAHTFTGAAVFSALGAVNTTNAAARNFGGNLTITPNGTGNLDITLPNVKLANNAVVTLSGRNITATTIAATGAAIKLGNIVATGTLGLNVATTNSSLSQNAGTTINASGVVTINTGTGDVSLNNVNNNFGELKITADDLTIKEYDTIKFGVSTLTGNITATSENGSIIQSGVITANGASKLATFIANSGAVTLATAGNDFTAVQYKAKDTSSLTDANAVVLQAGFAIDQGGLTVKTANGNVTDNGTLFVYGDTTFDLGTGTINVLDNNNRFGGIQLLCGGGTVVENDTLNLRAGSVVTGDMTLTSFGSVMTSGTGGSQFQKDLRINATGNITINSVITVLGGGALGNGLIVNATGTTDLSALSKAANLNNINPTNLGNAAGYTAPKN